MYKQEVKRVDPDCSKHQHVFIKCDICSCFGRLAGRASEARNSNPLSQCWFAKQFWADLPPWTGLMPWMTLSGLVEGLTDIQSDMSVCLFCNRAVAILHIFINLLEYLNETGITKNSCWNLPPMKQKLLYKFQHTYINYNVFLLLFIKTLLPMRANVSF